ncbi:predicted protein [Coccidioides posadasii str. Silveira]|uniref:Predicted protein n=1 Tax=Coccidioides posadasii (strain RMSCC 757 / Silveira) TaxID=443226 RepID=E9D213_COCPS|nr:predicted protein [Coccidioides posadasii str. Silveira]
MKVNRLHKAEKQNKKQMLHAKRGAERLARWYKTSPRDIPEKILPTSKSRREPETTLATAHQQSVPEAGTRGYSSSSARAITRMQRVSTLACMHACITNVSQHAADETPRSISWRDLARISRFSTFQREGPESSEIETVSPQQPWK